MRPLHGDKPRSRPKLAWCKDCGHERPANIAEFTRGVPVKCSACRIGEMEYIGTGKKKIR